MTFLTNETSLKQRFGLELHEIWRESFLISTYAPFSMNQCNTLNIPEVGSNTLVEKSTSRFGCLFLK